MERSCDQGGHGPDRSAHAITRQWAGESLARYHRVTVGVHVSYIRDSCELHALRKGVACEAQVGCVRVTEELQATRKCVSYARVTGCGCGWWWWEDGAQLRFAGEGVPSCKAGHWNTHGAQAMEWPPMWFVDHPSRRLYRRMSCAHGVQCHPGTCGRLYPRTNESTQPDVELRSARLHVDDGATHETNGAHLPLLGARRHREVAANLDNGQ